MEQHNKVPGWLWKLANFFGYSLVGSYDLKVQVLTNCSHPCYTLIWPSVTKVLFALLSRAYTVYYRVSTDLFECMGRVPIGS